MSEQTEDLVGLVDAIVRPLVDNEGDLNIQGSETEEGSILVEIRVNEEDAARLLAVKVASSRLSARLRARRLPVPTSPLMWSLSNSAHLG